MTVDGGLGFGLGEEEQEKAPRKCDNMNHELILETYFVRIYIS